MSSALIPQYDESVAYPYGAVVRDRYASYFLHTPTGWRAITEEHAVRLIAPAHEDHEGELWDR